jgi:hypothetical protein
MLLVVLKLVPEKKIDSVVWEIELYCLAEKQLQLVGRTKPDDLPLLRVRERTFPNRSGCSNERIGR